MGFETPNIDRVAKEGLRFLQYLLGTPETESQKK
jgi:arylsulfatase A-like enzyme